MRRHRVVLVLAGAAWCAAPLACTAAAAGIWGQAIKVPGSVRLNAGGNAAVNSVSCASAGNCAAGGSYVDGSGQFQAFVASEVHGRWRAAVELPGTATLNAGGVAMARAGIPSLDGRPRWIGARGLLNTAPLAGVELPSLL